MNSYLATSDWLSIVLSVIGVLSGAWISWIFFRTQLITDFNSLKEKLLSIAEAQNKLSDKIDLTKEIKDGIDLNSIKSTVEKLDGDLNSAVREILADVKHQQKELADKIQQEFRAQSDKASGSVKAAFSMEVGKYIANKKDQEKLLASLVSSFMDGMRAMGEYQRINIEKETLSSISGIENKISESITSVVDEVISLKHQVAALPSAKKR